MAQQAQVIALSDLDPAEKDKMLDFLAEHQVEFSFNPTSQRFWAHVQVFPPGHKLEEAEESEARQKAKRLHGSIRHITNGAFQPPGRRNRGCSSASASSAPGDDQPGAQPLSLKEWQQRLVASYPAFCGGLRPMMQSPKEMTASELGRFMEEAYADRYAAEAQRLRADAASPAPGAGMAGSGGAALSSTLPGAQSPGIAGVVSSFPRSLLAFAKTYRGVQAMVEQTCWSVAEAAEKLRSHHDAVELFSCFLDESYTPSDLLFFFQARDAVRQEFSGKQTGVKGWAYVGSGRANQVLDGLQRPVGFNAGGRQRPVPPVKGEASLCVSPAQAVPLVRGVAGAGLQERCLERLNTAMQAQAQAALDGRPDISVHSFLRALIEEFHGAEEAGGSSPGSPSRKVRSKGVQAAEARLEALQAQPTAADPELLELHGVERDSALAASAADSAPPAALAALGAAAQAKLVQSMASPGAPGSVASSARSLAAQAIVTRFAATLKKKIWPSVGDWVYVKVKKRGGETKVLAQVLFKGTTSFASGQWLGVETKDGSGKNDGSCEGKRYFECQPGHGLFVRKTAVEPVPHDQLPK